MSLNRRKADTYINNKGLKNKVKLIHKSFLDDRFTFLYFRFMERFKNFHNPNFVNRSDLINSDHSFFTIMKNCDSGWILRKVGSHWSHYNRFQMLIHLIRRNNHAGPRFLYFAPNSRVKIDQDNPILTYFHSSR